MVLKLYGLAISTFTQLAIMVLKETDTPYELVDVDFFAGAHEEPAYLEKQPFGQLPYIDDDGIIVFESRAIIRYIAAKARSPLFPTILNDNTTNPDALKTLAAFETATFVEAFNFHPHAFEIVMQRFVRPARGLATDEELVAKHLTALEVKLAGYERMLAKQRYLAGEEITLADLAHLPYGSKLASLGVTFLEDEKKFPNVARWFKEVRTRPSWQAVSAAAAAAAVPSAEEIMTQRRSKQ